jgi:hypothetical protein
MSWVYSDLVYGRRRVLNAGANELSRLVQGSNGANEPDSFRDGHRGVCPFVVKIYVAIS